MSVAAAVDPAVKATEDLNRIFDHLEVPCQVLVNDKDGKHVVATKDIDRDTVLLEEIPLVSWPSASFLSLSLPFCFHCLVRRRRLPPMSPSHNTAHPSTEATLAPSEESKKEEWTECKDCGSCFCSEECRQSSARIHRLLCPCLHTLRSVQQCSSSHTPNPTVATSSTSETNKRFDGAVTHVEFEEDKHHQTKMEEATSSVITPESLARCVAWIVTRLSSAITQAQLTHDILAADVKASAAGGSNTSSAHLIEQLFTQATQPFNRLIGAPDCAEFAGVPLHMWLTTVRDTMRMRCVKLLLLTAGCANTCPEKNEKEEEEERSSCWATTLVDAALSTATLKTLLGQLVLNAHAVNDYVLRSETVATTTVPEAAAGAASPSTFSSSTTRPELFQWIIKGGAVYTLLSSFNHSCAPNVVVNCLNGTHEIQLSATRAIAKWEAMNITYIPLEEGSTAAGRREQLKGYFFTCACSRCKAEDTGAAK